MRVSLLIPLLACLTLLFGVGCSEQHSVAPSSALDKQTGSVAVHVVWPNIGSRTIPQGTKSIKFTLVSQNALFANQEKVLTYPTTTTKFDKVMPSTWLLRAAAYASMDGSGFALASGEQMIDVKPVVITSATITMTALNALDHLVVTPTSLSLPINQSATLSVAAYDVNNNSVAISATQVSWQTSNQTIATVIGAGVSATATGRDSGTTTITVSVTKDGISKQATVNVTVPPDIVLDYVLISPASVTLTQSATTTLSIGAYNAHDVGLIISASQTSWLSADRTVATVGASGLTVTVTGREVGETTITATVTLNGVSKSATIDVTVVPDEVLDHVVISPPSVSLWEYESAYFTVTAYNKLNQILDIAESDARWRSSNTNVATIEPTGITVTLTGLSLFSIGHTGTTTVTVTVTLGGVTKQASATATFTDLRSR